MLNYNSWGKQFLNKFSDKEANTVCVANFLYFRTSIHNQLIAYLCKELPHNQLRFPRNYQHNICFTVAFISITWSMECLADTWCNTQLFLNKCLSRLKGSDLIKYIFSK